MSAAAGIVMVIAGSFFVYVCVGVHTRTCTPDI